MLLMFLTGTERVLEIGTGPELVSQLAPFGRLVVRIRVDSHETLFRIRKTPKGPSVEAFAE